MPAWLAPNRLVAIVTALLAIVGAIATLAADLNAPAAAAYAASALVLLGVVHKWLTGWQAWEARRGAQAGAGAIPAPGGGPGTPPAPPEPPMPAVEYLASRLVDALAASAPAGRIYTAPAPGPRPEYLEVQTLGQAEPTRIPLRPREADPEEGPEDLEDALAAVSSLEPEPEDLYVADPADLPGEERGAP